MSALARMIHSDELKACAREMPESMRPALQIVRALQAPTHHGVTFRWQMDPVTRRLVQVWAPRD